MFLRFWRGGYSFPVFTAVSEYSEYLALRPAMLPVSHCQTADERHLAPPRASEALYFLFGVFGDSMYVRWCKIASINSTKAVFREFQQVVC